MKADGVYVDDGSGKGPLRLPPAFHYYRGAHRLATLKPTESILDAQDGAQLPAQVMTQEDFQQMLGNMAKAAEAFKKYEVTPQGPEKAHAAKQHNALLLKSHAVIRSLRTCANSIARNVWRARTPHFETTQTSKGFGSKAKHIASPIITSIGL